MQNDDVTITVTFPDVDVSVGLGVARRMSDLFDLLWASGRLRPVMALYEGSEAVHAFTAVFLSAMRQLVEAEKQGAATVTVTVHVPPAARYTLIAFARRVVELLGDEATMQGIGADPLARDERAFIVGFVDRAEGVLAAG